MAALALMTVACSNDDNDIQTPAEQPAKSEGIPFTATISIGESASTRALDEDTGNKKIVATWETGEKVALIYTAGSTPAITNATVTKQTDGTATISTELEAGATNGSDVTIIYPAIVVDPTTRDVVANLLAAQDGTLTGTGGTSIAEKYDVRKGTGKLSISDGKATVNNGTAGTPVSLTNQNAIFKLTLKDIDATADVSATSVIISDQTGKVTTVTPASGYEKAMYVALPTTATTLKFLVTGSDSKKYFNMASSLTLSASYYQSTIELATVGHVIASNGKCYKDDAATPGGNTAVAKIVYLGDDAETSPTNTAFKNGLALALEDISGTKTWCSQYSATCLGTGHQFDSEAGAKGDMAGIDNTDYLIDHAPAGHTHAAASAAKGYNSGTHPAGTSAWFLPSAGQWDKMFTAASGYANLKTNVDLQGGTSYWSSTEFSSSIAWYFYSNSGYWSFEDKGRGYQVRACLAF
ncbi:MAG: hypothetical protein J6Y23_02975 [Prevotella sp.]|nr:hypothetical protein [Prevotella sp.]